MELNEWVEKGKPLNSVIRCDCLEGMKQMADNSVDLVVTSPPYDNLRDYKGYSFPFEPIARDLFRIIRQGGVVVWVVKDATINGNKTLTSFKQCLFFQSIGFDVYDVIIYSKLSGSPPHTGRYHDAFEYMFIFSKGKPKSINLLKDRANRCAGTSTRGIKTTREKNGTLTKKKVVFVGEYGIRFNIWEYVTGYMNTTSDKIAYQHPAIFPDKLAKEHIISWSNKGDLVLDCFSGSGTTCKMAVLEGRNYIGLEISPEYCKIAEARIASVQPPSKTLQEYDNEETQTP
jgi:site-specific DNA-methyltransferase (adenine-specific)